MDIKMPVMDGYTATRMIRELRPGLPVIAQTAYVDDKVEALKAGCVDFIPKPFNRNEFLEIIKKHLAK
jgi:CheY-like chemotaxis protein